MLRLLHSLVVTFLMVLLPTILSAQIVPPAGTGSTGCQDAPLLCDVNQLLNYSSSTTQSGSSTVCPFSQSPDCPSATCQNNLWFSFIATNPTMDITIDSTSCTAQGQGNGLQGAIGTLNGKSCGVGVYVYFIEVEFQDGHVEMYKGDITLTR